jgi:hypothetical protein
VMGILHFYHRHLAQKRKKEKNIKAKDKIFPLI